jgi:hypothetical protein
MTKTLKTLSLEEVPALLDGTPARAVNFELVSQYYDQSVDETAQHALAAEFESIDSAICEGIAATEALGRIRQALEQHDHKAGFTYSDYKATQFACESIYKGLGFKSPPKGVRFAKENVVNSSASAQSYLKIVIESAGDYIAGIFKAIYNAIVAIGRWIYNAIARLFGADGSGGGGGGGGASAASSKAIRADIQELDKEIDKLEKSTDVAQELIEEVFTDASKVGEDAVIPASVGDKPPAKISKETYRKLVQNSVNVLKAMRFDRLPALLFNSQQKDGKVPYYLGSEFERLETYYARITEHVDSFIDTMNKGEAEYMEQAKTATQINEEVFVVNLRKLHSLSRECVDQWAVGLNKTNTSVDGDNINTVSAGPLLGNLSVVLRFPTINDAETSTYLLAKLAHYKVSFHETVKADEKNGRFLPLDTKTAKLVADKIGKHDSKAAFAAWKKAEEANKEVTKKIGALEKDLVNPDNADKAIRLLALRATLNANKVVSSIALAPMGSLMAHRNTVYNQLGKYIKVTLHSIKKINQVVASAKD